MILSSVIILLYFVRKMVHVSDNEFELYLHMGNEQFGCIGEEEKVIRYKVFEYPESTKKEKIRCTKLKTIKLHYEDAVWYRAMSGKRMGVTYGILSKQQRTIFYVPGNGEKSVLC